MQTTLLPENSGVRKPGAYEGCLSPSAVKVAMKGDGDINAQKKNVE